MIEELERVLQNEIPLTRAMSLRVREASPDMVRRYTSSYNAEQAARRHVEFSPASMLEGVLG